MSPRGPKLQELADAVRDMAGAESSGVAAAEATITIHLGPIDIEVKLDEDDIDGVLDAIDWQGAIDKWKEGQGRPG